MKREERMINKEEEHLDGSAAGCQEIYKHMTDPWEELKRQTQNSQPRLGKTTPGDKERGGRPGKPRKNRTMKKL